MSLTRSLDDARDAYKHGDLAASIKAHSSSAEHHKNAGSYLKSAVYGGLDGIITTFAVVAGVAGASLSAGIVLILGFANLIADGISMAIGDYLSTKSEQEYNKQERKREEWELENNPEGEKLEMKELYMEKGLSEKDANTIVKVLEKNKRFFVDSMMVQELGIMESDESPLKNAIVTFSSFVIFGFIPLFAYVVAAISGMAFNMFFVSIILTAGTLFVLGALKTRFTGRGIFKSGSEMLIIGGIAAGAAYLIGYLLQGLG